MELLSFEGWFYVISVIAKVVIDIIAGFYYIYKAKTKKVKLLYYPGIDLLSTALLFSGSIFDFIHIISTGYNLPQNDIIKAFIIYQAFWFPIAMIAMCYLCLILIMPTKKNYFLAIYISLGIIFEIILFYDPINVISIEYPSIPGETLLKASMNMNSPLFYIGLIYYISLMTFGLGLLVKSIRLKGIIRKKFFVLALVFISSVIFAYIVSISKPSILLSIYMLLFLSTNWLYYYGLTPVREKRQKKKKLPSPEERRFATYILKKIKSDENITDKTLIERTIENKILIFISYATKDVDMYKIHEIITKLMKFPEIKNVLYWEEHLEDNIFEYMDENLGKCDAMVLFCSENALESIPVKKEWTAAEALGKPIIPVFYDSTHIPPLLSSRLGVQYDFYNMEKTVHELRNLILKKVESLTE